MRIDSIELTNYRCYASLHVGFQPGFNVVAGVNGSGKTSLLNAVCEALTGYCDVQTTLPFHLALGGAHVALVKIDVAHGRARFEPQYPVKVLAVGSAGEVHHEWMVQKVGPMDGVQVTGQPSESLSDIIRLVSTQAEGEAGSQTALPVFAFYRADRYWSSDRPDEIHAATVRNSRTDGYVNWSNASRDSAALQSWVVAKCLERLQASSESGAPFDEIQSDELALVNQALAKAVVGVQGLKYDLRQKSLLVEWAGTPQALHEPMLFEHLSDGQRAIIGLVADIARRMCLLNPQLGTAVTTQTPGVVLVDELDMHLHPRWQRMLTRGLKRAFPAVQFIVASHSPQVLGELRPDEIILLRPDGTAHPQVSYGLTSSQVLEEIMEAEARTPAVEKLLGAAFEPLERGELDLARETIEALEELAPGIPELAGAQALLRRKEVLGR